MFSVIRPILVYDETCAFCRRGVARLVRLAGGGVELLPSATPEAQALLGAESAGCERQLYLVHRGRVRGGAEAIARCLMLSRWWRLPASLYYVPGLRTLCDAGYRVIAARRHCLDGVCEAGS
jgi:predicted DCC family thiol-disulfide oxidoreductase YuxK